MDYRKVPFSQLLQQREIFSIFDEEFQKGSTWLDVAAIVRSESTIEDVYRDGTVPSETLDAIVKRIENLNRMK